MAISKKEIDLYIPEGIQGLFWASQGAIDLIISCFSGGWTSSTGDFFTTE
jgi:hypothetical protein